MSKVFSYSRFSISMEPLSYAARMEKQKNGEFIQHFVELNMSADEFVDKLFGIQEYIFIPREDNYTYQNNMMKQFLLHALYLLDNCEGLLDEKLRNKARQYLSAIEHIMTTEGWNNNRIIRSEVEKTLEILGRVEWDKRYEQTPLKKEKATFYVDKNQETILYKIKDDKAYRGFVPFVMYGERNQNWVEELECTINVLCDFLIKIEIKKSFDNKNINYMKGETDDGIHEEINFATRALGRCLRYLINSTSWMKNEWYVFDEWELELKQRICIGEDYYTYYENKEKMSS